MVMPRTDGVPDARGMAGLADRGFNTMTDHRLRVRQRFSGFYDLAVRQDGGATDIDGANFEAETYVAQLLKHKPLPELVAVSLLFHDPCGPSSASKGQR